MKIRFLKSVLVEVEKPRLEEIWDKQFCKWDEIQAEGVSYAGKQAEIRTGEGDVLLNVPMEAFEVVTAK